MSAYAATHHNKEMERKRVCRTGARNAASSHFQREPIGRGWVDWWGWSEGGVGRAVVEMRWDGVVWGEIRGLGWVGGVSVGQCHDVELGAWG